MENTNNMNILDSFQLKETNVFEAHSRRVPGSEKLFSRNDEKYLYKIQVFECTGPYDTYKALKVIFKIGNTFQAIDPWPVLDYKSSQMVAHMQEIEPMFVEFYQAENLETGEIRPRVCIKPFATPADREKALTAWNNRP